MVNNVFTLKYEIKCNLGGKYGEQNQTNHKQGNMAGLLHPLECIILHPHGYFGEGGGICKRFTFCSHFVIYV